jgi:hypothetical protein
MAGIPCPSFLQPAYLAIEKTARLGQRQDFRADRFFCSLTDIVRHGGAESIAILYQQVTKKPDLPQTPPHRQGGPAPLVKAASRRHGGERDGVIG